MRARYPYVMTFSDYKGPTGAYVATGERVVPLASVEGVAALGHSAMLSALGVGDQADAYRVGMREALEEAHRIDAA